MIARGPKGCGVVLALCIATAATAQPVRRPAQLPGGDPDERVLVEAGHGVETDDLIAILAAIPPSADVRARIVQAAGRLGDARYDTREQATREIGEIGVACHAILLACAQSPDPEVRRRARALLAQFARRAAAQASRVSAARLLGRRRAGEAFEVLLVAARDAPSLGVAQAAERSLTQIATSSHAPRLMELLRAGESAERALAARLLGRIGSENPALVARLADPDPRFRLAVAEGLVYAGEVAALGTLVALLGEEELAVRARAHQVLTRASGVDLGFEAHGAPEARLASVARWKVWAEGPGRACRIARPLGDVGRGFRGRIAYCQSEPNLAVELDLASGELTSDDAHSNAWAVGYDDGGQRWVCDNGLRQLVLYSTRGQRLIELAEAAPQNAMDLVVLETGTLLLVSGDENRIAEIDPMSGREVASIPVPEHPMSLQLLPDGSLLVALQRSGEIVEIDRAGTRQWVVSGLKNPNSARRLDNGNTLVCEMGRLRVVEIDPSGCAVWSATVPVAYDAYRMPNGNTLVAHHKGLIELDQHGVTVREIVTGGFVARLAAR